MLSSAWETSAVRNFLLPAFWRRVPNSLQSIAEGGHSWVAQSFLQHTRRLHSPSSLPPSHPYEWMEKQFFIYQFHIAALTEGDQPAIQIHLDSRRTNVDIQHGLILYLLWLGKCIPCQFLPQRLSYEQWTLNTEHCTSRHDCTSSNDKFNQV